MSRELISQCSLTLPKGGVYKGRKKKGGKKGDREKGKKREENKLYG